jgi:peptidyl-prolyl cis-trans isomerase SurA
MKLNKLFFLSATIFGLFVNAQTNKINPELENKWLVAVSGDTITAGDFWYAFVKNADEKKPINIDSLNKYKELYDKFLLKVSEAKSLGYDTTKKFLKEYKGYKDQLAQSYLKDKSVTENLVKEAFDRSRVDIEASHILLKVPYDAMPEDTLKAYKKAEDIIKKVKNGEDFATLADKYSEDNGVKNGGYLGFFSVLKMVYPFENAAYKTNPGEISSPFRSRFGYHILKVHSSRKAVGEIKVAHIMTIAREGMDAKKLKDAEKNINEIYQMLKDGKEFRELARKFSEDLKTSNKGGELPWFGPRKFLPEFENVAFGLKKK